MPEFNERGQEIGVFIPLTPIRIAVGVPTEYA
jgi:hypothetical protein